jgi:hypothetical protein
MPPAQPKRRPIQRIEVLGENLLERAGGLLGSFQVEVLSRGYWLLASVRMTALAYSTIASGQ